MYGDTIIRLRLDSNNEPDTEVIFEAGDILSASLADLNGDGLSEVVLLPQAGGLRIIKLMPNNSYASRSINATWVIRDGFNGDEYRSRWNLNADKRIRAIGDFDGDGADELLFSNLNRLVSLSIPDAQTPKLRIYRTFNNDRFDNLARKLDDFITLESLGGRSLNSMLTDYAAANVLSSHWRSDMSTRYKYKDIAQYPNMVDYDLNPNTYSVKFSAELDPNVTTHWDNSQIQWSEQYARLNLTGGAAQFVFERKRPDNAGAIRVMIFDEREFIEMYELDAFNSTTRLDYPAGFTAIVAIVAHEVPMDYRVDLVPL